MRFDAQATTFDARAGLPEAACRAVAESVLELGQLAPDECLLELGAGTGALGSQLLQRFPSYLGLDLSAPMLDEFKQRLAPELRSKVVQADAAERWPVANGSVGLVLGSRVLHLLPPAHVASETQRVTGPRGLSLLVGRVRRDPASVRARMRQQMRQFLGEAGLPGGGRDGVVRDLLGQLTRAGGQPIAQRGVARWAVSHSPRASLESWRTHQALAGVTLEPVVRDRILALLETWAVSTFGSLDTVAISEEEYVLDGVRVPPVRARSDSNLR
jgi:ubiquinone/menaquinone biosynthesis C-methylase UbiE